jgi:2-oxoglutarate ferredoxin oxidoreductase subunit beta
VTGVQTCALPIFYEGAFDAANPRKGGVFNLVPADHDVTNEVAAYKLAAAAFPGYFGVFYKAQKPTKNVKEAEISTKLGEKFKGLKDWQILKKTFDRMK